MPRNSYRISKNEMLVRLFSLYYFLFKGVVYVSKLLLDTFLTSSLNKQYGLGVFVQVMIYHSSLTSINRTLVFKYFKSQRIFYLSTILVFFLNLYLQKEFLLFTKDRFLCIKDFFQTRGNLV